MILLLSVFCVILYVAMGILLHPIGLQPIRLQFAYSGRAFKAIYQPWSDECKRRYSLHFRLDYSFLFLYGLLGYQIATQARLASVHSGSFIQSISPLIMPLAAAADALENLTHQYLIRIVGTQPLPDKIVLLAGSASAVKWLLFATFLLTLTAV